MRGLLNCGGGGMIQAYLKEPNKDCLQTTKRMAGEYLEASNIKALVEWITAKVTYGFYDSVTHRTRPAASV